ncbi:MAG TPA: 2-oxoglutarate oxidoreductase, partial [Synergistales bacterium]|nr:2-oxoglutarate oxidoreductase [Synergistales bacterium]
AIYGMTGGQMAPTTMPEQITTTSINGRDPEACGYPIRICELLSALHISAYIERVSLAGPSRIRKAREALRKAFTYQMNEKGFSFVEVLSNCPTNWKMTPVEAFRWQEENMIPYYPLGIFKDFAQRGEEE